MSIPQYLQMAVSSLLSLGLGLPTAIFGGCCCGKPMGDGVGDAVACPCCQTSLQANDGRICCLPECLTTENCQSCQSETTFVGEKLSHIPHSDLGETLFPAALAEPPRELSAYLAPPSPFVSHNARLSRISVWRK